MTDFPITPLQSDRRARTIVATFNQFSAAIFSAVAACVNAAKGQARRSFTRRTPDEILMAQTRREEARRAVDRLLR